MSHGRESRQRNRKNIAGKAEEGLGRFTGDTKSQAEGVAKQVAGGAQDLYGQARDAASDAAGAARDTAFSFEKVLRNTIETQPYTAAFVALGSWMADRQNTPPLVAERPDRRPKLMGRCSARGRR
jgi:uncharacterized protein YjbJ (UPF0337 family)